MALIYACVANKDVVLAEHMTKTGNFTKVVKRILEQIPQQDGKMSYVYERCALVLVLRRAGGIFIIKNPSSWLTFCQPSPRHRTF